jgi:RNA recognition motif-containing protein
MGYTKVFTGNLSFKTKEDQLAEQFGAAGKVVSANIITRGPRSLGYGFVEFETEQEAQNAVDLLNKKNIDGREINVELAKPREEKPQQPQQQSNDQPPRRRGGFRGGRRGRGGYSQSPANNDNQNNQAANSPSQGQAQGESAPRAPRRGRGPRNFNNREGQQASPAQGQQQEGQQEGDASAPQSGDQYITRGRGRGRGGRGRGRGGRGRGGRRFYNRPPRPQQTRVESTTSLFVANLPFDLDDAKLLELFKDHKAVKAHVVTNFQGRSRGFGFVDFDEKDQKAAFEATNQNQIVVSTRPLTVKIALVDVKPAGQPEEATPEAPAQN